MRTHYKKGLVQQQWKGVENQLYLERVRKSSEKMVGIRWQKGSKVCQDPVRKGNER